MDKVHKFESDEKDIIQWFRTYADVKRCKGGRIAHRMYCCLHCGSDNPDEKCLSPKPEKIK